MRFTRLLPEGHLLCLSLVVFRVEVLEDIKFDARWHESKVAYVWMVLLEEPSHRVLYWSQKLILESGLWAMTLHNTKH